MSAPDQCITTVDLLTNLSAIVSLLLLIPLTIPALAGEGDQPCQSITRVRAKELAIQNANVRPPLLLHPVLIDAPSCIVINPPALGRCPTNVHVRASPIS